MRRVLRVPVLRVHDERTRLLGGVDLGVDRLEDLVTARDPEASVRVGEVVLDVHDEERRLVVVPGHVPSIASMSVRVRVVVSGHVQGVFFRARCAERARRLGLGGWVRNLPDGRVEAVFEGTEPQVDRMIEWCGRGPPGARVDAVQTEEQEPLGATSFAVAG
jgi:acylphosphatase